MQIIKPTLLKDREVFLDVLRGMAILGIFIANLAFFSFYSLKVEGLYTNPGIDKQMSFLHAMFIEGKFYSIFSLLFGWGIALQINRSKTDDATTTKFIKRRLWFMLLLGGVHLLFIWFGDIVSFYAMIGFILIALRKKSNKTLLITGIVLLLSPIVLYFLKMNFLWLNAPAAVLREASNYLQEHFAGITKTYSKKELIKNGNFLDTIKANVATVPFRFSYLIFVSRIPKVLGMMLVGFVIGRSGFYKRILEYKTQLIWAIFIGLIISLPANYMLAQYMENQNNYWGLKMQGWYQTIAYALGVAPLAMVYTITVALLFQQKVLQKILIFIAPVGKMAFTHYIMHSLIGIITFYGVGFGYMQQVGPLAWTVFAVIVFIFQIIVSTIWLRYFEFGPIEWAWRSCTYGKQQKMRKH